MENLSKTAPVEITLNKSAAAEMDNSYASLKRLLDLGYTTVKWKLATTESCPICKRIAEEIGDGIDLAHFLGLRKKYEFTTDEQGNVVPVLDENNQPKYGLEQVVEIYRDAPIYNWAHVGCQCGLVVFKDSTGESEYVSHNG